jgi:ABC-type nitrate/sulfonate/bicarbonate transport system permease component
MILLGINQLQTPRVFAGVIVLMLMSIALFLSVHVVERLAAPWGRA